MIAVDHKYYIKCKKPDKALADLTHVDVWNQEESHILSDHNLFSYNLGLFPWWQLVSVCANNMSHMYILYYDKTKKTMQ